jgi:hypothetical protein
MMGNVLIKQILIEMGISFKPIIFINGYQLPEAYSIGDLQYFLLE